MAYKIIIINAAKADIRNAFEWYNNIQEGLGNRFTKAVRNEIATIKKNPLLYEIRYDDLRTAITPKFPYMIHFYIHDQTIYINAVYHTSRSNDLWIER